MEFEYTSSIWVSERDLDKMTRRVDAGENFYKVFNDIMMGYDDVDYYNCELIAEAVKSEVMRRVTNGKD